MSLEKEDYVLTGAVDLLLADDGALEILDFKAQARPRPGDPTLQTYYDQLCVYARILDQRRGRRPDRLLLYWTGEPSRRTALMGFPYRPEDVAGAAARFDGVVTCVEVQEFALIEPPHRGICKECDFRSVCVADGTIPAEAVA